MKKSNRVFIALIATLYIVPALTFGAAQFTSEKCLTGFTQKFQIISPGANTGSKGPVVTLLRGNETVFAGSQPPRFSIIG